MNVSDTERLVTILEALGLKKADENELANFVIFNTCSVKQKAEDKVFGAIKLVGREKKRNPNLFIGITGCMVRQSGVKADIQRIKSDNLEDIPDWRKQRSIELKKLGLTTKKGYDPLLQRVKNIDFVFRIEDIAHLGKLLSEVAPTFELNEIIDEGTVENYFKIAPRHESSAQAFVPVMTGCDKFCTYCIVPFTRGREYSRKFDDIISECESLVKSGIKEITLVGQTVNTYGLSRMDRASKNFDWYYKAGGQISSAYRGNRLDDSGIEKPFVRLLKDVDNLKTLGLKRLRYTSPHPRDFTDDVIDTLASLETVCPHIHMPVQSGSDTVLKRMNRNYSMQEYKEIMQKMRAKIPNLIITTDIIVGFCGETEAEFEETYQMYKELEWDFCYLGQYSPRKGTVSERMMDDDVPKEVKKERWERMNSLMKTITFKKNNSYKGKILEVLVEKSFKKDGKFICSGRARDSKEVEFESGRDLKGEFVNVKVTLPREWLLKGELV